MKVKHKINSHYACITVLMNLKYELKALRREIG